MDFIVLVLFLIVAILGYILYFYFYKPKVIVSDLRSLNSTVSIPSAQIISPTADTVYYEMWLYLNTELASKEIVFSHGKLCLCIQGQTLSIESIEKKGETPNIQTMQTITTTFPIQKWVYITVVRRGDILESYLNGKLIKTNQYLSETKAKIDTTVDDAIIAGSTTLNGYMTKFNRIPDTISAEEIWQKYLKGNGVPSSSATMQNYQAGIEIVQNKQPYGYYKIF